MRPRLRRICAPVSEVEHIRLNIYKCALILKDTGLTNLSQCRDNSSVGSLNEFAHLIWIHINPRQIWICFTFSGLVAYYQSVVCFLSNCSLE